MVVASPHGEISYKPRFRTSAPRFRTSRPLGFSNILRLFPFYVHHTVSQVMFLTKQHTTEKVYQIDGCLCNTLSQVAVVLHEPKHYESTMSYRLTHCSLR